MNQFFIGIIVMMGIGGWFLWQNNQSLASENVALAFAVEEQKQTIELVQNASKKQGQALVAMTAENAVINNEMNRYLDIFRRHNLNQLAVAKPGLIQTRVNKGTSAVFESIENDSKALDGLDDPNPLP